MTVCINGKKSEVMTSSIRDEKNKYAEKVKIYEETIFNITKKNDIKKSEKKIRDFFEKWYMEDRLKLERKNRIKYQKNIHRLIKKFDDKQIAEDLEELSQF